MVSPKRHLICWISTLTVSLLARGADASSMYAVYVGPASAPARYALFEVDPASGASQRISVLPERVWHDIEGRPGDATNVYSVSRLPGGDFENRVSTIDVGSGAVTDLFTLHASDFGYAPSFGLELGGIAIAASRPSVAVVSAAIFDTQSTEPSTRVLFDLDLDTGATSNVQTLRPGALVDDLTYSGDETLFTLLVDLQADSFTPRLATIDRSDGTVDGFGIFYTNGTMRSIEFDPIGGELYGVDGLGMLVRLSTTTGEREDIGQTGLGAQFASVQGLAFVVPEPGTGTLLAIGLAVFGLASQRRRHSSSR